MSQQMAYLNSAINLLDPENRKMLIFAVTGMLDDDSRKYLAGVYPEISNGLVKSILQKKECKNE